MRHVTGSPRPPWPLRTQPGVLQGHPTQCMGTIPFGEDSTGSLGLQEGLGKLGTCLC